MISKFFSVLIFTALLSNSFGQNFINNGSFEYGGPGLGFWIDGTGYNPLNPPYSGSTSAGNYAFSTNPQTINNAFFLSSGDHTTGTGIMMIIDGTTTGGQQRFWKAGDNGGGVCNLIVGQQYSFSYWIRTVSNAVSGNAELANIGVSFINASNINLTFGTTLAPIPNFNWQQVRYTFTADNSCVNIEMFNNNMNAVGNDFAIDDIQVTKANVPLDFNYSITQPNCTDVNSGLIVIYPLGGVEPYLFRITGPQPIPITNNSGVFQNVEPGTYTIGLMDATGAKDSIENVVINSISTLSISSSDTSICPGELVTLTASGGNGNFEWTSSNTLEPSFPNSNDSITVSPTINTTYTVSSNVNNANLIFNGDFQQGNFGFSSSYSYYQPSNPTGIQQAYGILTNPTNWYATFSGCIDHTIGDGTGKMMVVDGSTFNVGNDPVWCQKVAVEPNKDYLFSYWATGLTSSNSAQIQTKINGVSLGSTSVPNVNCAWGQVSYIWNSGNNLIAEICLVDNTYEGLGNDFALDDISLVSQNSCSEQITLTMANVDPFYDLTYPVNGCMNESTISPILGPDFISGGVFSSTTSGLNINPFNGNISSQSSIPGSYDITYTAEICGSFVPDTFLFVLHDIPQMISFVGGTYDCSIQQFDPATISVSGTPNYTVFYTLNDSNMMTTSSQNIINLSNEIGVYSLDSITDSHCSNALSGIITISQSDAPITPNIEGDSSYCLNSNVTSLTVTNVQTGIRWYSNTALSDYLGNDINLLPNNQETQTYYATQTVNGCESPPDSFTVYIASCDLVIPSAFTPNGDGKNDLWSIYALDSQYPDNIVRVYNRWGELLYESLPGTYSSKPWDGQYKSSPLPVGSYYYVIDLSNDKQIAPLNGTVSIILKK